MKLTKPINWDTVEIDGIDISDYPDFCDAYYSYAEYIDGTPLTDTELDTLTETEGETLNQRAAEDGISRAIDRAKDIAKYGH